MSTRTLPIYLAALPGEALDSWLEALAHRTHTRPGDLQDAVGLAGPDRAAVGTGGVAMLDAAAMTRIATATGVPRTQLEPMTLARYLTSPVASLLTR